MEQERRELKQRVGTFEDLECWRACRDVHIYIAKEIVPLLPESERFRLSDQLLRAIRSTAANIAEGYGRFHYRDNWKFCSISRGSCYEVLDHLITACDEGMIDQAQLNRGRELIGRAIQLLNGYMNYLSRRSRTTTAHDPRATYGNDAIPAENHLAPIEEPTGRPLNE